MARAASLAPSEVLDRLDRILDLSAEQLERDAAVLTDEIISLGEAVLETWLLAHGRQPTEARVEGFRLLGLHRSGARGDPSFNACRETCRELVYRRNVIIAEPRHDETAQRLRLQAMVARHLALFVSGKLEVADLGDFCCSSRPLRAQDARSAASP